MSYYIDLSKITLDKFKDILNSGYLLPSQQILKEDIDDKFFALKSQNIENVYQLQQALKTKGKINDFSRSSSLSIDYLIVLRRMVNSYHPQPRKIKDFTGLSAETKDKLENMGIKTTPQLFEKMALKEDRENLRIELGISDDEALVLAKISDVSRLRYVNPSFATLLVNSRYDTVEKIKIADSNELYQELVTLNENKKYYKGRINLKDMGFLVNDTSNVSLDVEY